MQTPLNKRVIGRHVGQKRKGSRAKSAQSGLEQPARSIDSGTDSAAATGRHSLWPPSAMQMICRGRLLPACLPQLLSLATVHLPLCMPGASNVPLPALATCWVAVRQKLKPNNDFQSKQQLGRQATLRRLQLEQRFNAIRFDSTRFGARREGIAQFAPRNYATNACGTRSSQLDIAVVVAVAVAVAVGVANFIT